MEFIRKHIEEISLISDSDWKYFSSKLFPWSSSIGSRTNRIVFLFVTLNGHFFYWPLNKIPLNQNILFLPDLLLGAAEVLSIVMTNQAGQGDCATLTM